MQGVAVPAILLPFGARTMDAQNAPEIAAPRITKPEPIRPAPIEPGLVKEFVSVSHGDIDRVRELIEQKPKLVYSSWDHGGGDWEMGLGAASHVGRRDIAHVLLANGARKDIFASAMLGERAVVVAMIAADPKMSEQIGPHGYRVLYHSAISGDTKMAEAVIHAIPQGKAKPHLNQALSAAVRDGHFDMTRWLLDRGATSVNKRDAIGESPLDTAMRRGDDRLAALLREHGAKEVE